MQNKPVTTTLAKAAEPQCPSGQRVFRTLDTETSLCSPHGRHEATPWQAVIKSNFKRYGLSLVRVAVEGFET